MRKKDYRAQKLTDISLSNVSGGDNDAFFPLLIGGAVAIPVGVLGGVTCSIASSVYRSKYQSALQKNYTKNAEKYAKTTKNLKIASVALGATATVGIGDIVGIVICFTRNRQAK